MPKNNFLIFRAAWGMYAAFIVYGSLIPFDFQYISFEKAAWLFGDIPYLKLGMYSREDWIANGILYFPLGCLSIIYRNSSFYFIRLVFILCFCTILAIGVEFIQLYFPGRTVSLNDIIAEIIGSGAGLLFFVFFGNIIQNHIQNLLRNKTKAINSLLIIYIVLFLLYCLFPFDFVLSIQEFDTKIRQGVSFFWNVPHSRQPITVFGLKLAAEFLTFLPFGVAAALFFKKKYNSISVLLVGFFISGCIELVQLFLVSGVTQGVSVLFKSLGFYSGYFITTRIEKFKFNYIVKVIENKWCFALCWIGYFLLLVFANWIKRGNIRSFSDMVSSLHNWSFIPFFYHYKMSESQALFSVAAYFILYVPVGCLIGLKSVVVRKLISYRQFIVSCFIGCFISTVMESGKFFLSGSHPDVTNLIVASFSSITGVLFIAWLQILFIQIPFQGNESV